MQMSLRTKKAEGQGGIEASLQNVKSNFIIVLKVTPTVADFCINNYAYL